MKKEAQVVMLPTDKKSALNPIVKDTYNNKLKYVKLNLDTRGYLKDHQMTANYLYIVDDSEIKEGDWYYWPVTRTVQRLKLTELERELGKSLSQDCKKIIATTDPDLWHSASDKYAQGCALIPQSFIESYCKNPVEKVMVEYDVDMIMEFSSGTTPSESLKLTSNNELIIHPIEEKLYTRKELYKLCKVAYRMGAQNHEDATVERLDEWFNLLQ